MNIMRSNLSRIALALLCIFSVALIFAHPTSATDEIPYRTYSDNSIYFYKQCSTANRTNRATGNATASGSTADEKIWSALKSIGLSDEIAAGILGNIHNEGGASPARREGCFSSCTKDNYDWENDSSKAKGLGLIQWSYGRRVNLIKYLRDKGAGNLVDKYLLNNPEKYGGLPGDDFIKAVDNPSDADTLYSLEVDFLIDEIKNNNEYKVVLNQTTVADAAEQFSIHVEACKECVIAGSDENKERIAAAEEIYKQFTGKSSFGGSSNISPCDCDDAGNLAGGIYAGGKYSFTDEELKRLWWAANAEEGSAGEDAVKTELSMFANIFEYYYGEAGDNAGLIKSVTSRYHGGKGWFAPTTGQAYETGEVDWPDGEHEVYPEPTSEQINIAKSILNEGHRTLPPEIVEHDGISDIGSTTNNGIGFSPSDVSQYKSGVTTIIALGDPYIFFQWANGEKVCSSGDCGDPFGYFASNPPSASTLTTTETSSITWTDDGWISGGIDGYTKEDASNMKNLDPTANQDFTTDMPNTKGKGPDQIVLHATESSNGSGASGLEFFKSKKASRPPHFTIDLKNKKLYQHLPIYKTAATFNSKASDSAGIQIAIIGYSDANQAKADKNESWDISTLTDSDLDYLAELIRGINSATGIDSTKLTGPSDIVSKLQKSLETPTTSECTSSGATGNIIADTALKLSWDCGNNKSCKSKYDPNPEYVEAMKAVGLYYADGSAAGVGASCDKFVATVMKYSGVDPDFNEETADCSGQYMLQHPELYEEINFNGSNFEVLKSGDIFSTFSPTNDPKDGCASYGHIYIYVELNGQHIRADASYEDRTAEHYVRDPVIHDSTSHRSDRLYKVFRKK